MKKQLFSLILITTLITACNRKPVSLRLMTHDSFEISEAVLTQFETDSGIQVEIFKSGDAGQMVNQAVLAKDAPLADVLFGVDNTFLSRALDNDIFMAYESPQLANIPDAFELDSSHRALPVDFGDVCLNYDKAWFTANNMQPPQSLEQLAQAPYASLTVVENPATSSPGLAFLMATISHFGEDGYVGFWQKMADNGVAVASGWEDAYYGQFTAASDGDRPIVVSYASSPAAEVFFATEPTREAPTAAITADGTCFRQIEFVGILNGTEHEEEAQQLVDYMLSRPFQEDIPFNMFVYPVNETAVLPDIFTHFSTIPANPAQLDPALIAEKRTEWIETWTRTVLR